MKTLKTLFAIAALSLSFAAIGSNRFSVWNKVTETIYAKCTGASSLTSISNGHDISFSCSSSLYITNQNQTSTHTVTFPSGCTTYTNVDVTGTSSSLTIANNCKITNAD